MARYVVAKVEEIPPGERRIFAVADRSVGIFNLGGEFFALRNRCPHQQGPVCEGRISGFLQSSTPGEYLYSRAGEILRCPWHGWEFDIRNGQSWYDPVRPRVRRYEVLVAEGSTLVAEPPAEDAAEADPDARFPVWSKVLTWPRPTKSAPRASTSWSRSPTGRDWSGDELVGVGGSRGLESCPGELPGGHRSPGGGKAGRIATAGIARSCRARSRRASRRP